MKAGRMRSMIHVFEPVAERNAFGEKVPRWEDRGRWHAERASLNGRRSEEAGEHFAAYSARWNVRIQHTCRPGWRIDAEDGLRYEVTAVEPYPWLGMQTIIGERVNL